MKRATLLFVALTAVVAFLLGLVASGTRMHEGSSPYPLRAERPATTPISLTAGPILVPAIESGGPADFAAVAARLNGAVVNVDSAARSTEEDRSRLVIPRRWP